MYTNTMTRDWHSGLAIVADYEWSNSAYCVHYCYNFGGFQQSSRGHEVIVVSCLFEFLQFQQEEAMGMLNVLLETLRAKTEEEVALLWVGLASEEIQEIVAFVQRFQWLWIVSYFPRHSYDTKSCKCSSAGYSTPMVRHFNHHPNLNSTCSLMMHPIRTYSLSHSAQPLHLWQTRHFICH